MGVENILQLELLHLEASLHTEPLKIFVFQV